MDTSKKAIAVITIRSRNELKQVGSSRNQKNQLIEFAEQNEIEIVKIFENIGTDLTEVNEMVRYCQQYPEIKYLIVSKVSRITRDVSQYISLKVTFASLGVKIISATETFDDTPEGTLMEHLFVCLAQVNNSERVELTKRNMAKRASQGYSVQRPPLGYIPSRTPGLYQKTNTATALGCYFREVSEGKMTVNELRRAISKIYHQSAIMRKSHFIRLCSNPYYAGFVSFHGKLYKGLHEPLISQEEQLKIVSLIGK